MVEKKKQENGNLVGVIIFHVRTLPITIKSSDGSLPLENQGHTMTTSLLYSFLCFLCGNN